MLYEAITQEADRLPGDREPHSDADECQGDGQEDDQRLAERIELPNQEEHDHQAGDRKLVEDRRITSYNVCYTKLLRTRTPGMLGACAARLS